MTNKDGFQEFQNISLQLDKDLCLEPVMEEKDYLPDLLISTVVQKSMLTKVLGKLSVLLDEELNEHQRALEFEAKFLEIIQMLKNKNISQNEFFEDDAVVRDLLKNIFNKIMRNISKVNSENLDQDKKYKAKKDKI